MGASSLTSVTVCLPIGATDRVIDRWAEALIIRDTEPSLTDQAISTLLIDLAALPTESLTLTVGTGRLTIGGRDRALIICSTLRVLITHTDVTSAVITLKTVLTEEGTRDRLTRHTSARIVYRDPFASRETGVAIRATVNATDRVKVFRTEALIGHRRHTLTILTGVIVSALSICATVI